MAADMIRVFDKDLAAARIPKRDGRDRGMDTHALRHTFGTHLAKAGVSPRTTMAAMRHSTIDLTMSVYTDPALLDVAGVVEALPSFTAKVASIGHKAAHRTV
ncbi:MAG: site-specific integrase [Planctomycetes bacterium]|nr:site-specific integrase [Planctomycetota bacterium]